MRLMYESVEITDFVNVRSAIHREASGGRCDCLELELENAAAWMRWKPQTDDKIQVTLQGYDTGKLFLNTIVPKDGRYIILATSVPQAARRRANKSYKNIKLVDLVSACAAECGMAGAVYHLDEDIEYKYLMRDNMSAAAFMDKILSWEGAAFKTVAGRFAAIGIEEMQEETAAMTLSLDAEQEGITYTRRNDMRLSGLTVKTPYAECMAQDAGAAGGNHETVTDLPALDAVTAGRWARGLLLYKNRQAEKITIETEFNPYMSAMARIDIKGYADASGEWLVDEAEHDLVNGRSRATLVRCIQTIA